MKNPAAKGRRLVQLARKILEAQGARVEVAHNAIRWIPKKTGLGLMPISKKHDYFGIWDLMAVSERTRGFYQVTVLPEVSRRREKILASGFPVDERDAIVAWVGGRGRHFRVLRGPVFETESEERWKPCHNQMCGEKAG